jgi:hypothetical protein
MALSEEADLKLTAALGCSVASEVKPLLAGGAAANLVLSTGTDATHLGFFGVTVTTRATAYTQTYSTSTKTHSAETSAALTDSTAGTPGATLAALTGTYASDVATIRNWGASLAAQVNALITDLTNVKGVLNAVIDDLQLYGLLS